MVTVAELLEREASSVVCLVDDNDEEFFEHHGIPGMKWGHRKAKIQSRLDRTQRVATGTASTKDRLIVGRTKKGANVALQRAANHQARIAAGKGLMTKKARTRMSELNFHKQGDAKAKMDRGQKAAAAMLVGIAAVHVATIVGAKRI